MYKVVDISNNIVGEYFTLSQWDREGLERAINDTARAGWTLVTGYVVANQDFTFPTQRLIFRRDPE